jgi:hypothetical protein
MQRLDDHDAEVQLESSVLGFRLDGVIRTDPPARLDEPVPTAVGKLSQPEDAGKRSSLVDGGIAAIEAPKISLLSPDEVLKGGGDGAISPGSSQLKLLIGELPAYVEKMEIRPLVIAKCLNPKRIHAANSKVQP